MVLTLNEINESQLMPLLTVILVYGLGVAGGSILSRVSKKNASSKTQRKRSTTAVSDEVTSSVATTLRSSQLKSIQSGVIAKADERLSGTMPLAIAGSVSAVAGLVLPVLSLPAILVCGYFSGTAVQGAVAKFCKQKYISDLCDLAIIPTLILLNQVVTASIIISLITINRRVLSKTQDRSRKSLNNILNALPKRVWILTDGVEMEVDYRDIKQGDQIIVNSNDLIPVDGIVVCGEGLVDQLMLTGESVPVEKNIGELVYAGTKVVSGRVVVEVEKSGDLTHAGEVSALILKAADQRSSIQERGEMIAEKSLPSLLIASTFIGLMFGLSRAISLFFVAPGYTMRTLAPLNLLQSLRHSAEEGILIKDGRSLELLHDIDTVVFDKTGTLTDGELSVAKVIALTEQYDTQTILSLAASAEGTQTHPIARAIVSEAKKWQLTVEQLADTEYTIARGIRANVQGREVLVGSPSFLLDEGLHVDEQVWDKAKAIGREGYAVILVGVDQQVVGIIVLDQVVRPEAAAVITALKQRGMQTVIISGDAQEATQHMAQCLDVDHYHAETLPADKAALIQQMQQEGRKVCFIGDGINDAIALKQANVSLSIRGSSTIAVDTAQIVLANANLSLIDKLFDVGKNYRKINNFNTRMSTGLPLLALPAALIGGGGVLLVVMAHSCSTWGGVWRIFRKKKVVN